MIQDLAQMLRDARSRTLALVSDLAGDQLLGPRLPIVNPPLWEVGHLGWFQERWCLRYDGSRSLKPSLLPNADALYNSSTVPHSLRWDLPLPTLEETLAYLDRVLSQVLELIDRSGADPELAYFVQLAVFHEDMHNEALTYTRQTLGYPPPKIPSAPAASPGAGPWPGDVELPGGEFMLGAHLWDGFVFDNEKWAHPVRIEPYQIARAQVTNEEFAAFVEDGGYQRRELWSKSGWAWRELAQARHPLYWVRQGGEWGIRRFDQIVSLPPHAPVLHVSWYEAEAYCRWAHRRLPTEAEWEMAAATAPGYDPLARPSKRRYPWGDEPPTADRANLYGVLPGCADVAAFPAGDSAWGCRQMLGNVWEWTADTFLPYPGFVVDPYRDYSAPWFGSYKVLRGGCYATCARLIRNTWRNFYTPERRDVFAGFRTCAL